MGLRSCLTQKIIRWLTRDQAPPRYKLCAFDRIQYEVRPCDVLLIEGRNRISDVIKTITQSRWSHAALYIGRLHDIENPVLRQHLEQNYHGDPRSQLLIESYLGQGTIVSPIDHYEKEHIRICRPSAISHNDAQNVVSYAISRLGMDYDVRQILDLARFLIPWSWLPGRWRSSLFRHHIGRATNQICSTLLAEAFASINFPILPLIQEEKTGELSFIRRNPRLCTPSDFDYSPYFKIIKYPLFEVNGKTVYRDLPWRQESLSNDTEGLFIAAEEENDHPEALADDDPTGTNYVPTEKRQDEITTEQPKAKSVFTPEQSAPEQLEAEIKDPRKKSWVQRIFSGKR